MDVDDEDDAHKSSLSLFLFLSLSLPQTHGAETNIYFFSLDSFDLLDAILNRMDGW